MTAPKANTHVQFRRNGSVGRIVLDRPLALNALTTDMVTELDRILALWSDNPGRALIIESASPKAFCAGGDIRAIQQNTLGGLFEESEHFFATEYRLNHRIASSPTPVVSLIDGICMGGGLGLSVHGTFRVVSPNASMAMPETGIGFLPDVGASHFLSRLPGSLGAYLGLTGARLSAADALYCGLATHFIDGRTMKTVAAVVEDRSHLTVDTVLRSLASPSPVGDSGLAQHRAEIDWCFAAVTIDDIDDRLSEVGTDWADDTRSTLRRRSRQSLELTSALLTRGRQRTLRQCLDAELVATRGAIRTPDFVEGVRAALVDKDRAPSWQKSRFAGMDSNGHPVWDPDTARSNSFPSWSHTSEC